MEIKKLTQIIAKELSAVDEFEWSAVEVFEQLVLTNHDDEEIQSKFITIDYMGHVPELRLNVFSCLEDIENHILSDAGITNAFTTAIIPIVNDRVKYYEAVYSTSDSVERAFNKTEQLSNAKPFEIIYNNLKLNWI